MRRTILWQSPERHIPVELGVPGAIELTHPALADEGGHVVVAEPGADVQGHKL